jgi:hypothetical protein
MIVAAITHAGRAERVRHATGNVERDGHGIAERPSCETSPHHGTRGLRDQRAGNANAIR